jgi:sugar lactone lactonase YvrE
VSRRPGAGRRVAASLGATAIAAALLAASPPTAPVLECGAGELLFPEAVAPEPAGTVLIADKGHHRVVRAMAGRAGVEVVAGSGELGFAGDGGLATAARLASPEGVVVDPERGDVYIADTFNSRVRRVDRAGRITTIAGSGDIGDGGPAPAADLSLLGSISVAGDSLYIADTGHHRVRAVDLRRGLIRTVAGTGEPGASGDGGPAMVARLYRPEFVAATAAGDLYIADTFNNRVRKVDHASGAIATIAGTGEAAFNGDGIPAVSAALFSPEGLAVDGEGRLYIADMGNDRIRRVDPESGTITTVAGTGDTGFNGDGRPGTETALNFPLSLAYSARRKALLIADLFNQRIRSLDLASGVVSTVAGTGEPGTAGDGGLAVAAQVHNPEGILVDGDDNLYIADHTNHRVRRVDGASGVITTVAGTGRAGWSGDGGPARRALLFSPSRLALWRTTLFVTETGNHLVRAIDLASGRIRSAVGGTPGRAAGPAAALRLAMPSGLALAGRDLYVADYGHHRVLRVALDTGQAATVAGTGHPGCDGDGPARQLRLSLPKTLALAPGGGLYIADLGNNRIRRLDRAHGTVTTVIAPGLDGFDRDGYPETAARSFLMDVEAAPGGRLLVADSGNGRVRLYDPARRELRTLVGSGGQEPLASPAIDLAVRELKWVALDGSGDLYVTDTAEHHVLKLPSSALLRPR